MIVQQSHEGPLPHPELLKGYNAIVPDGAERIFKMAEVEQQHRHAAEQGINSANIGLAKANAAEAARGQWMAFAVALSGMGIAALLIINGHPVTGSIFGGGLLASLVLAFLNQRNPPANTKK